MASAYVAMGATQALIFRDAVTLWGMQEKKKKSHGEERDSLQSRAENELRRTGNGSRRVLPSPPRPLQDLNVTPLCPPSKPRLVGLGAKSQR